MFINLFYCFQLVSSLELIPVNAYTPEINQIIHGTYYKNWLKIKYEGLSRMNRLHIHFTTELSNKQVISGMRSDAQVYIYIDLTKAIEAGINFFKSSNNVILSPGNLNGFIEPLYFLKVIDAKTGK